MTTRQGLLQLFVSLVAIAAFFISLAGGIEYIRLGDIAGRATFLSPYFSAILMMCSLLLYAAATFPKYARLWAFTAITAIILSRLGPQWSDAWISGRTIAASFATGLVLTGSVAALLIHGRNKRLSGPGMPKRDLAVALLGVTASTFITFALIEENIITRQKFAASSAKAVALDVGDRTARAASAIQRLTERWSAIQHMPSEEFMLHEFSSFRRDFTFFLHMALVNTADSVVLEQNWEQPQTGHGENLTSWGELDTVLDEIRLTKQTHLTVLNKTWWDGKTGVIISPLSSSAMEGWAVIASIDLADIVRWAMRRTNDNGYFRISHEGNVLYESADEPPYSAVAAGNITIPVHTGVDLDLYYKYTSTDTDLDTEVWAEFIWLTGIILTFLLIASLRLTSIAHARAVQLTHNALHDSLTGLPNRHQLQQKLKRACLNARHDSESLSVVFFDIEGIKLINDTISHSAGDAVLIEIAKRLQCGARPDADVQQLDGVEFVLFFTRMNETQVQERTEQIIAELSKPYYVDSQMISITVNAGIVNSDGHVDDPMELVRQADLAMLRSKQNGRNTCYTYTDNLSKELAERVELRDDLQRALDTNELQLHYQPIVEGRSGRVIGIEALLRWPHETRGYISPARFVPLAEETGQIVALTEWVLSTACRHRARLRQQGLPDFPAIVNISPLYFQHADFVGNVQRILNAETLPAQFLEIEITESVFLDNEKTVLLKLRQLREMGIRTSIDDFGTGYSSLAYLKNLPIDRVKIDRSFVIDVVSNPADTAIVQGIISMAHHLGLTVIAEGVETESQFAFLRRNNCDAFQGYLFAKPQSFETLYAMLAQSGCRLFPLKTQAAAPPLST